MRLSDLNFAFEGNGLARMRAGFSSLAVSSDARDAAAFALIVLSLLSLIVVQQHYKYPAPTSPRAEIILRDAPAGSKVTHKGPHKLSVFEKESAMSDYELLHRWDSLIESASKRFGVPDVWIRAVMIQESGGRTMLSETRKWISDKGAMGLMQIMPDTYRELRRAYAFGEDPFNAEDNINAGAAYLKWLHGKYGMTGMFAAYNAGPARLEQSLAQNAALPEETQAYVIGVARSLGLEPDAVRPPNLGMTQVDSHDLVPEIPIVIEVAEVAKDLKPAPAPELEEYWLSRSDQARDQRLSCRSPSDAGCQSSRW